MYVRVRVHVCVHVRVFVCVRACVFICTWKSPLISQYIRQQLLIGTGRNAIDAVQTQVHVCTHQILYS